MKQRHVPVLFVITWGFIAVLFAANRGLTSQNAEQRHMIDLLVKRPPIVRVDTVEVRLPMVTKMGGWGEVK